VIGIFDPYRPDAVPACSVWLPQPTPRVTALRGKRWMGPRVQRGPILDRSKQQLYAHLGQVVLLRHREWHVQAPREGLVQTRS
jgi:hypothetical protein